MPAWDGRSRIDGDHAHTMAHALTAEALREHVERNVGHAARDVTMVGAARCRPNDVNDDAAFACAHVRIDDTREIDIAIDLDVPGFTPGVTVDLGHGAGWYVCRVVVEVIVLYYACTVRL